MKFRHVGTLVAAVVVALAVAGCGAQQKTQGNVVVNSYKLTAADTSLTRTFNGNITAQNKVAIHARVSGHVIEKYINGGEHVEQGQPLFRLDARNYEAALASAQAATAQSQAAYQNAQRDLQRYETLAAQDAIARKTYDTQSSTAEQNRAVVEANEAQVRIAQSNLDDTVIYAPFSGTVEMDDVDLGTYVTAGGTTLVTMNSTDPVYVEFSLSEAEYLSLVKEGKLQGNDGALILKLADGSTYAEKGRLVQSGKTLDANTGKMTLKAEFPNPNRILLPGMYATIISSGDVLKDAILVPTKAILQVLDKNFLMVIRNGKVEQVPIEIGSTQGIYTVVTKGVSAGDEIVVDGLTKVKNGMSVDAKLLTKADLEK